jgi:tRNA A37 N6-isopentenylltransferase MiaA
MSDNKTTPSDLDLLIASINDLAREIGEMEPDDPVRAVRLKELYTLTELSTSLKTEGNKTTDKRIDTVRR